MMKKSAVACVLAFLFVFASFLFIVRPTTHAATGDCTLVVPAHPLTANGLATPYQLQAPCTETDPATQVFVQGAVFSPETGKISIYNPLVIDAGSTPAAAPVVPVLTPHAVVALWFGFNGNNLTLAGPGATICQQGMVQFAYCHAPAFFQAVNHAHVGIPPLGVGLDGKRCPSSRDFSIVDQDQSDNTPVTYLLAHGQIAQNTAANRVLLAGAVAFLNPSDELVVTLVDKALGCHPWLAPDLADPGALVPALPLNELQADRYQHKPIGLIPAGDPFVGPNNLTLVNRYRRGVDQPQVDTLANASTVLYCKHLLAIAPARLALDKQWTANSPSLVPTANSLFTFLAQRFVASYSAAAPGLDCQARIGQPDPITLIQDNNGVTVDAIITLPEKEKHA